MPLADVDYGAHRIVRQLLRKRLAEFGDGIVDHGAAVGRARRRVDAVERRQLQDVFGVDRVRVAQQILDLGDAELPWPRREGRFGRGTLGRFRRVGLVELARQRGVARAFFQRGVPAFFARDGGEPLHEA